MPLFSHELDLWQIRMIINRKRRKFLYKPGVKFEEKVPAKGGARPDAMLLLSIPTGFFSVKLLYIVHAASHRNTLKSFC